MGNICPCQKKTRLAASTPGICSARTYKKAVRERQHECDSVQMVKENSTNNVKNSEVENETPAEKIIEYKVLPPIRHQSNTVPHIYYKPNRVWGGSVHSFLTTINKGSVSIDDIIAGKAGAVTQGNNVFLASVAQKYESQVFRQICRNLDSHKVTGTSSFPNATMLQQDFQGRYCTVQRLKNS